MTRITLCLLFLIALFSTSNEARAQDEKFKSIFIYNFTKLIEWPPAVNQNEFVITVYGSSAITDELKALAAKMKVGSSPIVVKQISALSQFSESQILFFSREKTTDLSTCADEMQKHHVLLISEKASACTLGAAINFVTKNGNLAFEVKPANIDKTGLKVNSKLLSLGTVVNE